MRSLVPFSMVFLCAFLVQTAAAFAAEVTVVDPIGNMKATATTEGTTSITVDFQLPEGQTLADKRIELRNKADGAVVAGTIAGNAVVFENVSAGTWELLADPELIAVAGVSIGTGPALAGAAGGSNLAMGVLGGAVVAGGAATGIVLGTRSSDNNHPLSPAS